MSDFVSQMVKLRNKAAAIAGKYGNPDIAPVAVRNRDGDGNFLYFQIEPDPHVSEQIPRPESLQDIRSVEGLRRAFTILGVGRNYSKEQLKGEGVEYVVGARLRLGRPVGGVVCQFVSVEERMLTWELQVVEKISEKQIYDYL